MRSAAEAPPPCLIAAQRTEEVDLSEVGPEHDGEIELRVDALPEQEPAQTKLTAGAQDEIGVGEVAAVQEGGQRLRLERAQRPLHRASAHIVGGRPAPERVDDLLPA